MAQDINSLITGLSQGLTQYLNLGNELQINKAKEDYKQTNELQKETYKSALDLTKDQNLELYKMHLQGNVDENTASAISPAAAKAVGAFKKQNGRLPTIPEADKLFDDIKNQEDKGKQQKSDDVRVTQWARLLSSDREFTNVRTKRDNLENVGALLDQVQQQGEGPDKRQKYELAMGQVKALLGNNQISEKEVEQNVPQTLRGTIGEKLEWLTNHPTSTEAQDFVKRSKDFFERETRVTKQQSERRFDELSDPYVDILSRNPNPASRTYKRYGVTHEIFNPGAPEQNKEAPKSSKSDPLGLGI